MIFRHCHCLQQFVRVKDWIIPFIVIISEAANKMKDVSNGDFRIVSKTPRRLYKSVLITILTASCSNWI